MVNRFVWGRATKKGRQLNMGLETCGMDFVQNIPYLVSVDK